MKAAHWFGVVGAVVAWGAAGAQEPVRPDSVRPPSPLPSALAIVADSTLAPFERPNGTLLRPGAVTYEIARTGNGQLTPLGTRTVEVAEGNLAGMPAWLVTETRAGTVVETRDSLWLTRAELSPQRWVASSGRAQLAASWTRDTVFGALQSYQGRTSFTLGAPSTVLVTPGMVERVVEMLPLRTGYRAGASLVVIEPGSPRVVAAELAVDREESLTLGDRAVDCWVVALRSGTTEERLWVTKEQPRVVKTEQAFPTGVVTAVLRP